jgi:hypothetical protein
MKSDLSARDERREEDGKKFIVNNHSIVCSLSTLLRAWRPGEEFELALAYLHPPSPRRSPADHTSDEIRRSSTRLEVFYYKQSD